MTKPSDIAKVGDVFRYRPKHELDRYKVIEIPSLNQRGEFVLRRMMKTPELQAEEDPFPYPKDSFDECMVLFESNESLEILPVRAMIVQASAFGFIDEVKSLLVEMEI